MQDAVDKIIGQWKNEGVDRDLTAMETIGRIARIYSMTGKKMDETFAIFGLNRGEFDVLAALRRSGSPYTLTPTELFDTLMVTSGTMTNRLINLEKRGLIVRDRNEADKRSTLVRLTDGGIELMEKCLPAHMDTEDSLVSGMGRKKLEKLNGLLKEFESLI